MEIEVSCPLLTDWDALESPSRRDGVTRCAEVRYRILACDLVGQAGVMLGVYAAARPS